MTNAVLTIASGQSSIERLELAGCEVKQGFAGQLRSPKKSIIPLQKNNR
jgi:hypothetical protein